MPARCLNKVMLIGNLTRDPELRYTPSGSAVCSFGLATNRYWATETGDKKEDTQFHRVVAWNKLAEICSQLLGKGDKVYLEGRLQTRQWTGQDGIQRKTTEIVISDMILLRSQRGREDEEAVGLGGLERVESPVDRALEAQSPAEGETTKKVEEKKRKGKAPAEGSGGPAAGDDSGVKASDDDQKKDDEAKKKETGEKLEGKKAKEDGGEEEVDLPEDKTPF